MFTGLIEKTAFTKNIVFDSNGAKIEFVADFDDVKNTYEDITTTAGLAETGLKGYALAKAQEMLNAGASSCNVDSGVDCYMPSGGDCLIDSYGDVYCYDSYNYSCYVGGDDSHDCMQ